MHTLTTDAEISALVLLIGWFFKLVLRPSKIELTLILNIILYLVSYMRKWTKEHAHVDGIKEQLRALHNKINRDKIVKG